MLWVAAVLAYFADLLELTVAITLVIVLNGLFAFLQERLLRRPRRRAAPAPAPCACV